MTCARLLTSWVSFDVAMIAIVAFVLIHRLCAQTVLLLLQLIWLIQKLGSVYSSEASDVYKEQVYSVARFILIFYDVGLLLLQPCGRF